MAKGSYRKVHYKFEQRDAQRELSRIDGCPNEELILEFEAVLTKLFQETQAIVHVRTGSLKLSGKQEPTHTGKVWRGKITYGGASEGVNNPVKYAEFELERGGAHFFMEPLIRGDEDFGPPIERFLRGDAA